MQMRTATCGMVDIIGCIILRLSGTSAAGVHHETRQIVYVTEASNKLFLSREACVALGLVSRNFPAVGENSEELTEAAASETAIDDTQCNCPRRAQEIPPIPTQLPPGLSATEKDVPALKMATGLLCGHDLQCL